MQNFFKIFLPIFGLSVLTTISIMAQTSFSEEDALFIKQIFDKSLTEGKAYNWLENLSENIGGRLAGSPEAAAAVEYTRQELLKLNPDTVILQPCLVPHWVRGEKEQVRIVNSSKMGTIELKSLALGNSIGTGPNGITAEVVEVKALTDLEKLGKDKIQGKIVFFNRPFDNTQLRTFYAYGKAVDQRVNGPAEAAKYGAVAAIVRSMTGKSDDVPHTGVTVYANENERIPAVAISTQGSDLLSRLCSEETIRVFIRTTCENLPKENSYNVIAEIKGSEYPDEIIVVGGHLDSWDVGGGAHDDGAGCVHSMEVMNLLKSLNYQPKRTIRVVMFMNEENGLAGGLEYARVSNEKGERHIFGLESDAGGFTPQGFSCDAEPEVFVNLFQKLNEWLPLLEPYNLHLNKGGSGADIGPLKSQLGLLCGLRPDSQRYFDYHHTETDRIDKVHPRELALGSAAMTSLVYLVDKYGI
ncbi:MAG: M28 family peptidase [Saprospiraceae bacterium]